MEGKPSMSTGSNGTSLKTCPVPWKPRCFRPGFMRYTSELLGFISKVREPSTETGSEDSPNRYVFRNGLYNPQICPRISEMKIPAKAILYCGDRRENEEDREGYSSLLRKLSCLKERSTWGFKTKNIDVKPYIPCNIHDVHEQQQKMSPIIQYINWNPDVFQRIKPQFVCNRFILKWIMTLPKPHFACSFLAEKKDGVIFLREVYGARINASNKEGKAPNILTSVILSAHKHGKQSPMDMNESTYGAFVGNVGPNIKVLFSAEIDAFWGSLKENRNGKAALTGLQKQIVELKTTHHFLWSERNSEHWKTMMAMTWAQCHLIGNEDVLTSVLLESGNVNEILHFKVNSMLENIKCYNGHEGTERESFFFNRLHSTLVALQEQIVEDTPAAVYLVTVTHPIGRKVVTNVIRVRRSSDLATDQSH